MNLEKIDTSYWLTKDKAWMEARKAQWLSIEKAANHGRKKTEVNVIKQYFLRGKMPKWEKYQEWHDIFRPFNLAFFLWLHPSSDPEVLTPLYQSYMESTLVDVKDITSGYGSFLGHEFMRATSTRKFLDEYDFPFMGEKNIIVFRILFNDLDYAKQRMFSLLGSQEKYDEETQNIFEHSGYLHFVYMRNWLLQDLKSPIALNCLYQYDEALEWCLTTLTANRDHKLVETIKTSVNLHLYQRALYCIHHFDTEKEGDTCRTRAIYKIRQILDERDFIPEFKQMWLDVKAGKIEVENPWKR